MINKKPKSVRKEVKEQKKYVPNKGGFGKPQKKADGVPKKKPTRDESRQKEATLVSVGD